MVIDVIGNFELESFDKISKNGNSNLDELTNIVIDISNELQDVKPETKRPLDFRKIKSISRAGKEIQKHTEYMAKKERVIIGGSGAAYAQTKKFRRPNDLDIHMENMKKYANHILKILQKVYGHSNVKQDPMVIYPDGVKVIPIRIYNNSKWEDAIDIKNIIKPGKLLTFVQIKTKNPIKIGNLYYRPIGELIARKANSIGLHYIENIRQYKLPAKRSEKDIKDFVLLSKSVSKESKNNIENDLKIFKKKIKEKEKMKGLGLQFFSEISNFGDNYEKI